MRRADANISAQTEPGRQRTQMETSRSDAAMGVQWWMPKADGRAAPQQGAAQTRLRPRPCQDECSQALLTAWGSHAPCALHPDSRLERNREEET